MTICSRHGLSKSQSAIFWRHKTFPELYIDILDSFSFFSLSTDLRFQALTSIRSRHPCQTAKVHNHHFSRHRHAPLLLTPSSDDEIVFISLTGAFFPCPSHNLLLLSFLSSLKRGLNAAMAGFILLALREKCLALSMMSLTIRCMIFKLISSVPQQFRGAMRILI